MVSGRAGICTSTAAIQAVSLRKEISSLEGPDGETNNHAGGTETPRHWPQPALHLNDHPKGQANSQGKNMVPGLCWGRLFQRTGTKAKGEPGKIPHPQSPAGLSLTEPNWKFASEDRGPRRCHLQGLTSGAPTRAQKGGGHRPPGVPKPQPGKAPTAMLSKQMSPNHTSED